MHVIHLACKPREMLHVYLIIYTAEYIYVHYVDELEKWEVPPINEVNKKLEKIEQALKRQDDVIEELRSVYFSL